MSGVIRVKIEQATVADFRRIETRTGRPMVRFRAEVGQDRLAVIVFNEAAERLDLADGDTVDITGRLQGTSWAGADGSKKFGWQVVAEQVEQHDSRRRITPPPTPPAPTTRPSSPTRDQARQAQERVVRQRVRSAPFTANHGPAGAGAGGAAPARKRVGDHRTPARPGRGLHDPGDHHQRRHPGQAAQDHWPAWPDHRHARQGRQLPRRRGFDRWGNLPLAT